MSKKKIELLAPAGTIEAFHAAIDGGADAIYCGFGEFNARGRSKNFTAKTLSYLVPHAQSKGVKVYITMNTLIKDGEIPRFVESANELKQIKPDAVIVQDLGMASLFKKYYPNIDLHASTQMAIHNSVGFDAAKELGVTRVVPARELTLQEIYKINNKTKLEIELFIHGALCYSLSGNCLASSFLGGSSGNRGKCTQVCRRKFTTDKTKSGFYFSPKDFWAIDYIDEYKKIGITSLKIEGRMKSPEYAYTSTSAYRDLIDGKISIDEAKMRLNEDFGRPKCSFLLNGEHSHGIVSAGKVAGTGLFAGKVQGVISNKVTIDNSGELPVVGDRVRFQNANGDEGITTKVEDVSSNDSMVTLTVGDTKEFETDGSLYIVSRKNSRLSKWKNEKITVEPRRIKKGKGVPTGKVMATLDKKIKTRKSPILYIKVDSLDWLKVAANNVPKNGKIILSLNETEASNLTFKSGPFKKLLGSTVISIPTFIPETSIAFWKKEIARLQGEGVRHWMVGQFGFKNLFTDKDTLYADYPIWTINRMTQNMLSENGFKFFTYSPEDDIMNLKRTGADNGLFPAFMKIPLFQSRVDSVIKDHKSVESDDKQTFTSIRRNGLDCLISDQPLGLTHRVDKLMSYGINRFILDFSWYDVDRNLMQRVIGAFNTKKRVEGSSLFNHKMGMK